MSWETAASHVAVRTAGEQLPPAGSHVGGDGHDRRGDHRPPGDDAQQDEHRLHRGDPDGDRRPPAAQPA